MSVYIVQTAAAAMPRSCWGVYRKVAVLEVADGMDQVAMISARARGVIRIVHLADKLNVGKTARCAYERQLAWAKKYAAELNAQKEPHHA